jgi:hypothetical protein
MTSKADRPSIVCRVTATGFMPATAFDLELFQAYKIGSDVTVEVKQVRSKKLNSLYWRNLGKVVEASESWPSSRALHTALLIRAGHIMTIQLFDGGEHVEPRSLTDMDDAEFEAYLKWAFEYICTKVIPGLDLDEFHHGNFVMRENP